MQLVSNTKLISHKDYIIKKNNMTVCFSPSYVMDRGCVKAFNLISSLLYPHATLSLSLMYQLGS